MIAAARAPSVAWKRRRRASYRQPVRCRPKPAKSSVARDLPTSSAIAVNSWQRPPGSSWCRSMTVLRDLVREKLVEIIALLEPGRPAALLLDHHARRLVSGGMTLSDTIWRSELDLALVEAVEVAAERRAPDGAAYMQAVYLLSPTAASVELLLADYEDGAEPVYGGPAHVVFTRRLPEHLLARLKECAPLVRRARSLIEANFDFVALQARSRRNSPAARNSPRNSPRNSRRAIRNSVGAHSEQNLGVRSAASSRSTRPTPSARCTGPPRATTATRRSARSPSSWRRSAPPSAPSVRRCGTRHARTRWRARSPNPCTSSWRRRRRARTSINAAASPRSSCSSEEWI